MCGGVGHQGGRGLGRGGWGPWSGVEGLDVNRLLLLLEGWPEVWGSQGGRSGWSSPVVFAQEDVKVRSVFTQRVIRDHEVVLHESKLKQPLLNDLAPGVRRVDEVPQVVVGYDDPVRFFREVEQEPVVMRGYPLATDLSGGSEGEQPQVF